METAKVIISFLDDYILLFYGLVGRHLRKEESEIMRTTEKRWAQSTIDEEERTPADISRESSIG